ncbi:hypothetical protein KY337_01095 [Candidatus Woesearchaeota archaeon]|nr:hypothetical protein [Candidatus Woesearchaeota archaeon]
MEDEIVTLGGNIELSGFKDLDSGSFIILKKIIGNYARKMSDMSSNFERLSLTMKHVHETEASKKYDIKAKLMDNGKSYNSEMVDRNLFVAVDTALKKLQNEIS